MSILIPWRKWLAQTGIWQPLLSAVRHPNHKVSFPAALALGNLVDSRSTTALVNVLRFGGNHLPALTLLAAARALASRCCAERIVGHSWMMTDKLVFVQTTYDKLDLAYMEHDGSGLLNKGIDGKDKRAAGEFLSDCDDDSFRTLLSAMHNADANFFDAAMASISIMHRPDAIIGRVSCALGSKKDYEAIRKMIESCGTQIESALTVLLDGREIDGRVRQVVIDILAVHSRNRM